ncbi:glutamine synthetase family protein [Ructibacterium gallinarum]|uniref:Glutamine synthetase n=1 Tax=Ructibacterium gallinarum TaxID=2779355 RepID=A0A9D5M026_9FIRM|nr:glutamine synthetase family protein [Ructibacterium gallinarum]MBE5038978.1 glutamine synthetase [Ructibacterium gallinarum]
MKYSKQEVLQYVQEDDVKFIRLAFCDVFGRQKNISIMPEELPRAFEYGIAFDASAIKGFGDETHSDLLLHPDPETLMQLPWRPEHGKVVRMFSTISYPDGHPFERDTRQLLIQATKEAEKAGCRFAFGAEQEFYLFRLDENGNPTKIPYDYAGYMDIAPDDKGENIRREICLTLEQMGIRPESSHHEEGPGQNEIDFRYSDPVSAADNVMTFQTVVRTVAQRNGLFADFSPKPLRDKPGNGFHINMSVKADHCPDALCYMIAGVLDKVKDMTAFLNPAENSYERFGSNKAPEYISWSSENRSQLMRIPAAAGEYRRAELRSPDPSANPYLALTLIIYAGLNGIEKKLDLPMVADFNLYKADPAVLRRFQKLPADLNSACKTASDSAFIKKYVAEEILHIYCG